MHRVGFPLAFLLHFRIRGMRHRTGYQIYIASVQDNIDEWPQYGFGQHTIAIRFLAIIDACVFNYFDDQIVDEICVILARLLPRQAYHSFTIHLPFSGFPIRNCKFNSQKIAFPSAVVKVF